MKKQKISLIVFFILLILLESCAGRNKEPQFVNLRGVVFGTYYSISYYSADGRSYQSSIDSLFKEINHSLSYYDPGSVISRINRNDTNIVDDYFATVFNKSMEIASETDGAFDPTVSPLVNAWGFGFEESQNMTPDLIDSLKALTGHQRIRLENNRIVKELPQIQLDFNAIAKGYASDLAGKLLEKRGVETYMVEIGGDLVARGLKPDGSPWRIGIEKPAEDMYAEQDWAFMVEMHNRAIATSGSTRKYYEKDGQRFSHTINPLTGWPVQHNLLSVSVFADDCITADGYATAFMVMGMEESIEFVEHRNDLEAFFIYSVGQDEFESYTTSGLDVKTRSEVENEEKQLQ